MTIQLAEGITIDANAQVEYRGERRGHIAYLNPHNAVSDLIREAWDRWLGRTAKAKGSAA